MRKMDFYGSYFFGCFLRHASATATAAHASTASGQTGQRHYQLLQAVYKVAPASGKGGADAGEKALIGGCVGLHLVQVDIHGALLHLIAVPVQLALPAFDLGLHLGEGVLDLQQIRKSFGLFLQLL